MPELPEVETMVRGIRPALEGRQLVSFERCPCPRKPLLVVPEPSEIHKRIENQRIVAIRRRAKRIVIELASGDAFVIEPRMTGLMLVADPPSEEHLRAVWHVKHGRQMTPVWFWDRRGLGTIRLLTPEQQEQALGLSVLGPDALDMTIDDWKARLARTDRQIKVALLDQKLVAGIGNLYASEILFLAKVHPEAIASRLSRAAIQRIAAATTTVLETAIRYEGSTLGDGTYRNVLNQDGSYQNEHRVYAKADETCSQCQRSTIRRIVQAQRSTFFCPRCQRKGRVSNRES